MIKQLFTSLTKINIVLDTNWDEYLKFDNEECGEKLALAKLVN